MSYQSPQHHSPLLRHPYMMVLVLAIIIYVIVFGVLHYVKASAYSNLPTIRSGVTGYCLDITGTDQPDNQIDTQACDHTYAQTWIRTTDTIKQGGKYCLSSDNNFTVPGTVIVLLPCTSAPGQIWLQDRSGFLNPHSNLCLSLPDGKTGQQLVLASCNQLGRPPETWQFTGSAPMCDGSEGQKVACFAEQAWTTWQNGTPDHETLLTQYTDGTPYEEWCADFVSYVYKAAGYPFTQGEADGWNENDANNIQNMGFTRHDPASYTPQPGDVAYFDYNGGHVEIVISGGQEPTFIYGDSATTDPTTGNGQMATNTLLRDGSLGTLQYYLSPN